MKTDADYLTEHTLGRYLCPCIPNKRRIKKKFVKFGGRHPHDSLAALYKCISEFLVARLRNELHHFPILQLAQLIVINKALKSTDSLYGAMVQLVERDKLYRCTGPRELFKKANLITRDMREKNANYRELALCAEKLRAQRDLATSIKASFDRIGSKS